MNVLATLRDSDFGSDLPFPEVHTIRHAVRAVVLDHMGNVALLHARTRGYYKLPGGGVEEGEDIATALARELLEEIGCTVTNVRPLGRIEEYRAEYALHQFSDCFVADVDGEKGAPQFTDDEVAEGFEVVWMNITDAEAHIQGIDVTTLGTGAQFMVTRESMFLKASTLLSNV